MRLRQIAEPRRRLHEGALSTAGHIGLDAVGLIPGAGEAADLANAAWFAQSGDYFQAALSLISLVPGVGDAVGKGIRYATMLGKAGKAGKAGGKVAELLSKHGPELAKGWEAAKPLLQKAPKLKPYAKQLDAAVKSFLAGNQGGQTQQQPQEGPPQPPPEAQAAQQAQGRRQRKLAALSTPGGLEAGLETAFNNVDGLP